jgi:hypothetical protein
MFLHLYQSACIALSLLAASTAPPAPADTGILDKSPKEVVQMLGKPARHTEAGVGTDGALLFESRNRQVLVEFRNFKSVVVRITGKTQKDLSAIDAMNALRMFGGGIEWVMKDASSSVQRWESQDGLFSAEFLMIRGHLIMLSKPWQDTLKASSTLEGLLNPPPDKKSDKKK